MAGAPTDQQKGRLRPSLALGAGVIGCALLAPLALAQELQLPTILRPSATPGETIDGSAAPRARARPPAVAEAPLAPRAGRAPTNATRRSIRRAPSGAEASRRLTPAPLRRDGAPTLTVTPTPVRRRPIDSDPFAPVGVQAGGFTLRPSADVDVGHNSNPNRLRGAARGSFFVRPGAELRVDSNWPTHSFQGLLRGSYSYFSQAPAANRPEAEARATWRYDLTRSTQIMAEGRFRLDTQSPQTTNLPFVTASRPLTYQYGATLGAEHTINRLAFDLRGSIDRYSFEDAPLPGGGVIDQSDRAYNQPAATLRASYELTPGVRPFVEGKIDARLHDKRADSNGYRRDSIGVSGRVGTTLEINRTLTGEASVGYERRKYDDGRLAELRGLIGDASLIWSASPLTTIGLRAQTSLDETTTPGVAGAVTRRGTVEIAHAFLRNLTLTGTGSFQRSDYKGASLTEDTMSGTVRLDYRLSRTVAVRASYTHERMKSTAPGADYTANIFMVGLRLQR